MPPQNNKTFGNDKNNVQKNTRRKTSPLLTNVIEVEGKLLPVTVRHNPRARRFVLRVDLTAGRICVTAPSKRSMPAALAFAREHEDWIAEQLQIVPDAVPFSPGAIIPVRGVLHQIHHAPDERGTVRLEAPQCPEGLPRLVVCGDEKFIGRRVMDWLKAQARIDLNERVLVHTARVGVRPRRITLRDQTSRWGSCSSQGSISLSWRLILAPPDVYTYVVAHEVAHLKYLDHSPAFWAVVDDLVTVRLAAQAWLKEFGAGLYGIGARGAAQPGDREAA